MREKNRIKQLYGCSAKEYGEKKHKGKADKQGCVEKDTRREETK